MRYKRPLALDILPWFHTLLLFASIYPFLASLFLFKGTAFWRIVTACFLLLLPIIFSWFLLQRIRNLLAFMACGVFISAITTLAAYCWGGLAQTSGAVSAALAAICSLVIFGIRAYTKATYGNMKRNFYEVHSDKEPFDVQECEIPSLLNRPQPYHWVWLTLLYLPGMLLHFTTCLYILFGILFADVFLCLSYHYISSLYEYVRQNQRVANLPVVTMKKIHRMTGIIAALLLFLFLLPSLLFGREFEPDLTTEKPLFTFEEVLDEGSGQPSDPEIINEQILEQINSQIRETPKWLRDLTRILGYLFGAGIILGIIFAIIQNIRRLGKDFAVEEEDEVIFLEPEYSNTKRIFSRTIRETRLSANQQIRRRYRKTIRKSTKGQPSKWATPSELERDAALSGDAAMQALHDAYEKARYSENGCTREDLSNF